MRGWTVGEHDCIWLALQGKVSRGKVSEHLTYRCLLASIRAKIEILLSVTRASVLSAGERRYLRHPSRDAGARPPSSPPTLLRPFFPTSPSRSCTENRLSSQHERGEPRRGGALL
jgi:hypothetical protein